MCKILDMWFWDIEAGVEYNSYVSQWNFSMDGSWGYSNLKFKYCSVYIVQQ